MAGLKFTVHNIGKRMMLLEISNGNRSFAFVNLHVPILSFNRKKFYMLLEDSLSSRNIVLIGGDFNTPNSQKDHAAFLTSDYGLCDVAGIRGQLSINTRSDSKSANRLDRFYVHQELSQLCDMKVKVMPFSDHVMLWLKIASKVHDLVPGYSKQSMVPNLYLVRGKSIDVELLKVVQESAERIKNFNALDKWEYLKYKWHGVLIRLQLVLNRGVAAAIANEEKKAELELLKETPKAEELAKIKVKIDKLTAVQCKNAMVKLRDKIHITANSAKNVVFKWLKTKKVKNLLVAIQDKEEEVNVVGDILELYRREYSQLAGYQFVIPFDQSKASHMAPKAPLKFFPSKYFIGVDKDTISELDRSFSVEEIERAVKSLRGRSAPGPDRLPGVFYKFHFKLVAPFLLELFNLFGDEKADFRKVEKFNRAIILPTAKKKNGSLPSLVDIRPLAMLNGDVKILSKMLLNRISEPLSAIIHPYSTAVKGRGIVNSLMHHYAAFHLRNAASDRTPMLVRIDLDKAFTKVNTDYLNFLLLKYFGNNFTSRAVMMVVKHKQLAFELNKVVSPFGEFRGGLLQGSPLSSLLYVIYLNDLIYQLSGVVKGVKLKGVSERLAITSYMDDVTFFVNSHSELTKILEVLESFRMLTGSSVNFHKSYVQCLRTAVLIPHPVFKGNLDKILGVEFVPYQMAKNRNIINVKIEEIKTLLISWEKYSMSILKKVQIINKLVVPKLIYLLTLHVITATQLKLFYGIVVKFIFKKKVIFLSGEKSCYPQEQGGLGLLDVRALDIAIKARLFQKIFSKPGQFLFGFPLALGIYRNLLFSAIWEAHCFCLPLEEQQLIIGHRTVQGLRNRQSSVWKLYKNKALNNKVWRSYFLSDGLSDFTLKWTLGVLPTYDMLGRRGIVKTQDLHCRWCLGHLESQDHIFFHCSEVKVINDAVDSLLQCRVKNYHIIKPGLNRLMSVVPRKLRKWILSLLFGIWKARCRNVFGKITRARDIQALVNEEIYEQYLIDYSACSQATRGKLWSRELLLLNPCLVRMLGTYFY